MKTYLKKPMKVRAVQFSLERWVYQRKVAYSMVLSEDGTGNAPCIETREGKLFLEDGDFIIEGQSETYGVHYWVNKPDYFHSAYEEYSEGKEVANG